MPWADRRSWPLKVVAVIVLGAVVLLAGLTVLVIEAHVTSGGVLGVAGVMAGAAGVGLMIAGSGAAPVVAVPVSIALAVLGMMMLAVVAHKVMAARGQAALTGAQRMIGTAATVRTWSGDEGQVVLGGTLWRARVSYGWDDGPQLIPGDIVIVDQLAGLTLSVRRRQPWETDRSWLPSSLSS